jgi:DNA-binding GntR family transcriptional regulator
MGSDEPQKVNATEQAYRSIRGKIVSGEYAEGERLTETRLSEELGFSRTPVREAIGRLILEGFVENHGGYTTRVAEFPEDEVEQVYEIRRLLECYSARRAARLASEEEIARLRAICERMKADTPPADEEAYQRLTLANEEFHKEIVSAARSPRLRALIMAAFDMGMVVRTYRMFSPSELRRSLNHHLELIEAIEARQPDWAESVMSAHLLAGASRVSRKLDKSP